MRTVSILTAAAALISTMGMAAEPAQQTFTRDGHTYVYSTSAREGGRTLIEGREVGSASRFRLLVDGNRVTGHANGYPVSFRTQTPLTALASAN